MPWHRGLSIAGLLWGLLGLSSYAASPEGMTPAPRPSSNQAGPPTTPFLRIETGMHTARINRIAVDAAERYLVTASYDKTARVWELATGKLLQILRPPLGDGDEGKLYAVAISPDGATVAVGGWTVYDWEKLHSIYLFDRDSGRLIRRITGLPNVVFHLIWSPDGRYLAVVLFGANGIRIYRTTDFSEVARDEAYGSDSYGIDFDPKGWLVASSFDGFIRLYDASFRLLAKQPAPGGKQPYSVRFSPEGDRVAVGFHDSTAVNVLSGQDLSLLYAPDTRGIDNGNLMTVAWSQDGWTLYAGGRYNEAGILPVLEWSDAGHGPYRKWPASTDTLMGFRPLPQGRLVFGAADPAFGIFDTTGRKVLERLPVIVNYRDNEIRISPEGSSIEFGFKAPNTQGDWNRWLARWDFGRRQLVVIDPGKAAATKGKIESRAAAVVVQVDAPQVRSSLYVLSIGVDNYKNRAFNLKYATADATEVAEQLRRRGQGLFQAVNVEPPLLNEAVTVENITRTFDRLAERVGVDDVFVLFLAGHGLGVDGEYYFFAG